jgi:hypothetical protein
MSMFRDMPDLASQLRLQRELVLKGTNLAEGHGDRQRGGDFRIAD